MTTQNININKIEANTIVSNKTEEEKNVAGYASIFGLSRKTLRSPTSSKQESATNEVQQKSGVINKEQSSLISGAQSNNCSKTESQLSTAVEVLKLTKCHVSTKHEFIMKMRTFEEKALKQCKAIVSVMKDAMKRQKNVTMDIKTGVIELDELLEEMGRYRQEWIAVEAAINSTDGQSKLQLEQGSTTPKNASTKRAVSSPVNMSVKKRKNSGGTQKIAPSTKKKEEIWQTVQRKVRRVEKRGNHTEPDKKTESLTKEKRHGIRLRSDVVVVKPAEGKSYAEILKQLRTNINPAQAEITVRRIRKTRAGDVLLEIGRGGKKEEFCETIRNALKETATVKDLQQMTTIEVRDLDTLTNDEKVTSAVKKALQNPEAEMKVKVSEANTREQKRAFVSLSTKDAKSLISLRRLLVGWTRCRMQIIEEKKRCYKCFGSGHVQANCDGPDRKAQGLCIRCGEMGHKMNICKKPPKCCICTEKGLKEVNHLPGSGKCNPTKENRNLK